jgi:hypothetical protein
MDERVAFDLRFGQRPRVDEGEVAPRGTVRRPCVA